MTNETPMHKQIGELPLAKIRVLDLSRGLAGPWVGQCLADFGAEVIKVEQPGDGDYIRNVPPFLKDKKGETEIQSTTFLSMNRGKRSITINIADPRGQQLIRELALKSDVFIENFKVDNLAKYGLDYESIRKINPHLVYCSVTGFGQTGPYRHRAGYDPIAQAMGGLMSVTGVPDDKPGGGPMKAGIHIVDLLTGMNGFTGVLLALYQRDANGGQGQQIDVCLLDSQVSVLSHMAMNYLITGRVPVRLGNELAGGVPQRTYDCADAVVYVSVGAGKQFERFCQILGVPDLALDPRFQTLAKRIEARDELNAVIEPLIAKWKAAELLRAMDEMGIPGGPINDLAQVFADPQVIARELVVRVPHPTAGDIPLVSNAVRLSETPAQYRRAPPFLGAETEEVLSGLLGRSNEEIADLRNHGVI